MSVTRRPLLVADMTLVTAGAMTANVAGYLLQLLAGRWLGVNGYSEFASLLAVQLLCAVPALALQNVVAREFVRGAPVAALRALQWRCAAIVAVVALALIPVVTLALDVGVLACAGALAAAPAQVLLTGEQGILQGERRFRLLAVVLGAAGIARVVPALALLALAAGAGPALWGTAFGLATAAALARALAGTPPPLSAAPSSAAPASAADALPLPADPAPLSADPASPAEPGWAADARNAEPGRWPGADPRAGQQPASASGRPPVVGVLPVLRAAQVQAALMAMSSADLIVVRMVLDEAEAGRYALGAIAAKIAFWLPAAVGVVLYPRMAQPAHSARAIRDALAVLSVLGVVAVLGAAVAAPLAPLFAGQDYAPVQGLLWLFALHGAILAVLQGAVLSAIAVDRTTPAALTWLGLAVEVTLMVVFARTAPALIGTAVAVAATTTLLVVVIALRTDTGKPAERRLSAR
ncbi:polysaccharide biosynthesis protein [Nocardia shimofusensis]|uniref:polysaccharide biosynthesis protein n=1 Tax=Nocardia shimofusensis TaxID=228596 RepID=UPI00082B2A58|nr:polysaccharide biosynthesis protein [Nocardia shimofusensis]